VETKAHLCFLKEVGGRCGCVYGTKGAVDRKSLGTTGLEFHRQKRLPFLNSVLLHIIKAQSFSQFPY
jgi:hypothetical protein